MDRTNISEIFQKLVLDNHIIPYGQRDYIFSFRTVFRISKYFTYCWCPCAYEHENFDDISETGEINQEMFQKISESIRTGACPHFNMVSEQYVTLTNVGGVHVVAAVGSEERILSYLNNLLHKQSERDLGFMCTCSRSARDLDPIYTTGKFKQTPYSIALLKNRAVVKNKENDVFKQFLRMRIIPEDYELCTLMHGNKDCENSSLVKLQHGSLPGISLQQQSSAMLKCIASTLLPVAKPGNIAKVYELVYRQGIENELLSEINTLMSTKLKEDTRSSYEWKFVAETLIVCNQPDQLEKLLKECDPISSCNSASLEWNNPYSLLCSLKQTCNILHRLECLQLVNRYCSAEELERNTCKFASYNIPLSYTGYGTFRYLLNDHPYSNNVIQEAFRLIPNISHAINIPRGRGLTPLHLFMCEQINIKAVKMLLENGSDINVKLRDGESIFTFLFQIKKRSWRNTEFEYRQILELLIFSNPSVNENGTAVAQGLKIDAELFRSDHGTSLSTRSYQVDHITHDRWKCVCHQVLPGTYLMDAKEHSALSQGYLDISLNFTGPLLIESGFPIQPGNKEEALQKPLHPAVQAYLQSTQCQDIPRRLSYCCRDTLRKHFRGRQIHEYVKGLNIPKSMKDFILLKTILHTISLDDRDTVKACKCSF